MITSAFQYQAKKGWSVEEFPNLDSETTLVLVFASPMFRHDKAPIEALAAHFPKSTIIGCSTAGEIFQSAVYDNSLSVAVIKFEYTTLQLVSAPVDQAGESYESGAHIAQKLHECATPCGIFVLSDGLHVNGSELIKGLNQHSASGVVITGGLAGDGSAFKSTFLIEQSHIVDHRVLGLGFYSSQLEIGHGSRGGWHIFGPERLITCSAKHILYELDSKPALKLYKTYLGEMSTELPAAGLLYPLAIRNPAEPNTGHLVRTILAIDEEKQALIFAGDVPEGYYAQLMRANFDELIDSANEAGTSAYQHHREDASEEPLLAIAISCVGRRLLLGERIDEETEVTKAAFPPNTVQLGFYSYGELSPLTEGNCELHNQTMTITTFRERKMSF